ncbi:MAG: hypothetical protein VZS44_11765 [Bacilli bacterium]|nr:hypothetical protein [Bacilli bacterium]
MNKYAEQIASLREQGYAYKDIAQILNLSSSYVGQVYNQYLHLNSLYIKTGWDNNLPTRVICLLCRNGLDTKEKTIKYIQDGKDLHEIDGISTKFVKIIMDNI